MQQIAAILSSIEEQTLFHYNPVPMWIYDVDTLKFLGVNNAAIDSYGYSEEEFLSMTLTDIRPKSDIPLLNVNVLLNDNNLQKSGYWRHKKKDGTIIYVDIHSSSFPSLDKIKARLVMAIDVTARKLADDKLVENERVFRTLADTTSAAIFMYKIPNYIFVNKSAAELTGYSIEELTGMNFLHIVHPDDKELVKQRGYARLRGQQSVNHYELRIVTKTGEVKTIDFTAGTAMINNERVGIGTAYDITGRISYESEIIKAKEIAETADRLKTTFLANMSHELRTPLVGILGFAEILAESTTDPDQLDMTNTIVKSGKRLLTTLNTILDISKIEADKLDLRLSRLDFSAIVSDSVHLFKHNADEKGLFINIVMPDTPVIIYSDAELLNKIFDNLLSNAVKFTNKGGITVRVYYSGTGSYKFVNADVMDTGIGISSEFREVIFEPFRQVSEGLSRIFEGSGLGLTLTKRLAELLKGKIRVKSTPGSGSVFTVSFPLPEDSVIQNEEKNITGSPDSLQYYESILNKKVLLVEDDLSNADVICAYLKDYIHTDHVKDGFTAVDFCKEKNYDIILMDINLKGIDGVETFYRIRKLNEHYSVVPVIAITAYAMKGDREKFLKLGFNHYISKPFKREDLLDALVKMIK